MILQSGKKNFFFFHNEDFQRSRKRRSQSSINRHDEQDDRDFNEMVCLRKSVQNIESILEKDFNKSSNN